jgi:hypothetical protein
VRRSHSPTPVSHPIADTPSMPVWRRYELYEDRSSGSPGRITLTDEHGRNVYVIAPEPARLLRHRRLILRDLVRNERARLRMKRFGPLTYQLVRRGQLEATITKQRLRSRDRFIVTTARSDELVATAKLGTADYKLSEQGRTVARLTARRVGGPPELQLTEGTDPFLVVAVAVVIYLFEYYPGRS